MNISSVNAAANPQVAYESTAAPPAAGSGISGLGINDFLKLITIQLQNQDPLKPMDDTEFISQMTSFTNLQQTQALTADFEAYSQQAAINSAHSYLGGYVTVSDQTLGTITGQVTSVAVSNGTPKIVVNGVPYDLSAIQSVSAVPPAAVPANSGAQPQG